MKLGRREERIREVLAARQEGVIAVFEDIHDPHNAAAVLRSCDAFGIQEAWFIFKDEKRFNPARVGKASSSSANKWLSYRTFDSTKACLTALRKKRYRIVATVLGKKAKSLFSLDLSKGNVALFFGNEHRGLSEEAINGADSLLHIPMRGMAESLNLSVMAGITLFELTRQRIAKKRLRPLTKRAQNLLVKDFLKR